jgi:hypothetical protein
MLQTTLQESFETVCNQAMFPCSLLLGLSSILTCFATLFFILDELHLTPFHGAVQLRPSFKYLDKIDDKKKQATRKVTDEDNKEMLAKQKAEQEQKAKALQVCARSGSMNLVQDK